MSNTLPNEGFKLQIESATPGTYTDIPGLLSVSGPAAEVASVETTGLADTHHVFRASKIPNEGEVSLKLKYDPNDATHILLQTYFEAGTTKNWKTVYVDGMTTPAHEIFAAFITKFDTGDHEIETNSELDVTIKLTGGNARTAGA